VAALGLAICGKTLSGIPGLPKGHAVPQQVQDHIFYFKQNPMGIEAFE